MNSSDEAKQMKLFCELQDGSFRPAIFTEFGSWKGRVEKVRKTDKDWVKDENGISVRIIVFN